MFLLILPKSKTNNKLKMIKLYTQIALTEDIPAYALKKGDTAMVIEHYPMPDGQEDGYSLEGFDIPILGITLEVKASQIQIHRID